MRSQLIPCSCQKDVLFAILTLVQAAAWAADSAEWGDQRRPGTAHFGVSVRLVNERGSVIGNVTTDDSGAFRLARGYSSGGRGSIQLQLSKEGSRL